ncbi:MAG: VWA domain-containing protein [Alphaproteobacteria bacterium]|nr:VWA domain-containing protein [Alphaproteobacteria bacterium]
MFQTFTSKLRAAAVFGAGAVGLFMAPVALADSISPTSYSADLAVGASTTITKTVTISAGGPTTAVLDVMFVFDTTGSMGGAIDTAKSAASAILTGLSGFGSLNSGVGQYDDPGHSIVAPLSGNGAATQAGINSLFACFGSCGGDFPEVGFAGIREAANSAWRAGSARYIVAFGDATFKNGPDALDNEAGTAAALAANGVSLIGLEYGSMGGNITALGGTVFAGSSDPADVVAAILAGVSTGFASYNTVTVGDLGAGLPEIGVTAVCTGADIGTCSGDTATGAYDRSVDRTFTFDVTFTRLADGATTFDTHALVDRKIVASERDTFGGAADVPAPATLVLLGAGLAGLGIARRRAA